MTGNIVARRYAKALFAVGAEQGEADLQAYGQELAELAGVLEESPEAMRFFRNPVFSVEEKKAVLQQLLGKAELKPAVKSFCSLLADKDRLGILPAVSVDFQTMLDDVQGVVRGKLVTAIKLNAAKKKALQEQLEKQTGKKLELEFATDEDILGGLVLQVGDRVMDASLRAQLQILKETIKRGE